MVSHAIGENINIMNYTYTDLEFFLNELKEELKLMGRNDSALLAEIALDFRYGSASEFLGESRIALIKILDSNRDLSTETLNKIALYIRLIDRGFEIANNP